MSTAATHAVRRGGGSLRLVATMHPEEFPSQLRSEGAPQPCALLVEPDVPRATSIASYFESQHWRVEAEARGDEAFARVSALAPTLILIDANAPGLNGQEFCRRLRATGDKVPLVILADDEDIFDHIVCLELGADDYVISSTPERLLWARLKAVLRRNPEIPVQANSPHTLRFGGLLLDHRNLKVRHRDASMGFTMQEFTCLWLLAENAGTVVTREQIRERLDLPVRSRSIDTRVSRVRQKLEKLCPGFDLIRSVRSIGYLFAPPGA